QPARARGRRGDRACVRRRVAPARRCPRRGARPRRLRADPPRGAAARLGRGMALRARPALAGPLRTIRAVPDQENAAAAGISEGAEPDVAELFERLREELRRGTSEGTGTGADVAATRALAERFWPVTAEREVGRGPKAFAKRVLRKLMRWYVEPLAADQRMFNDSVLKLLDALSARTDETAAARDE